MNRFFVCLAGMVAAMTVILSPVRVQAQEIPVEEVVVSSTPLRESMRDIAQPVTVLGGDQLRREVATSIGETLASQLGVSATYFGPAASRPVIRGLGGDRVLMLQDGVAALDVSGLSEDHAVSIESVLADQVEILKGPATLLYGSGAVGGVVNVLDGRISGDFTGTPVSGGALEVRGDSALEERSVLGRLDLARGPLRVHVDGFRRETGEAKIPGYAFSAAERAEHEDEEEEGEAHEEEFVRGRLENSDSETQGGALGFSLGDSSGFVGFAWSRFDTLYGVPAPHEHHEEGEEEEEEHGDVRIDLLQDRYDFKAERIAPIGPFSAIRFRGTYNDYQHRELEGAELGTRFDQRALETRLTFEHAQRRQGWRGVFGVQYLDVDFAAEGAEAFVPPSVTRTLSAFAFEKRPFGDFTVELGARAENQRVAPAGIGGHYDATAYSLSAGGLWALTDEHSVALSLARAQRHPQAAELYADGPHLATGQYEIGAAGLRRETAHTADLTLHRHTGAGLHWTVGAFYSDFSDYIFAAATGAEEDELPVFQYGQADARFHGFEAEIAVPLFLAPQRLFEVRLAADHVRGRLRSGGNLPRIPPLRYGAELHYEHGPLHLGMEIFIHDAQNRVAANERRTAGYTLLDADASYRFQTGGRSTLLAFLRASNLLDEEARRHTSPLKEIAPLPGRSVLAGLRMEF
jgi:iron complex outermembrane receptor protein